MFGEFWGVVYGSIAVGYPPEFWVFTIIITIFLDGKWSHQYGYINCDSFCQAYLSQSCDFLWSFLDPIGAFGFLECECKVTSPATTKVIKACQLEISWDVTHYICYLCLAAAAKQKSPVDDVLGGWIMKRSEDVEKDRPELRNAASPDWIIYPQLHFPRQNFANIWGEGKHLRRKLLVIADVRENQATGMKTCGDSSQCYSGRKGAMPWTWSPKPQCRQHCAVPWWLLYIMYGHTHMGKTKRDLASGATFRRAPCNLAIIWTHSHVAWQEIPGVLRDTGSLRNRPWWWSRWTPPIFHSWLHLVTTTMKNK